MAARIPVTFELSKDMLLALGQAADAAQTNPSDYLRAVLRTALQSSPVRLRGAESDIRLAIALASDWLDLQGRLRAAGYVLRLSDDTGLYLHSWPRNQMILPIKDIGHSLAGLMLRFSAPFPGDIPPARRTALRKRQVA